MADFFVSYNKADRSWAEWIAWRLEDGGYSTILQDWDFRPGENFVLAMHNAAAGSTRTIAVLSPDYLEAGFTQSEWAAAFAKDACGKTRALIPVRVRECKPPGLLRQVVYVDLVGRNETEACEKLLAAAQEGRSKPNTQPSFPGTGQRGTQPPRYPGTPPGHSSSDRSATSAISPRGSRFRRLCWRGGITAIVIVIAWVMYAYWFPTGPTSRWLDRLGFARGLSDHEIIPVESADRVYLNLRPRELLQSTKELTGMQADLFIEQTYKNKWIRIHGPIREVQGPAHSPGILFIVDGIITRVRLSKSEVEKATVLRRGQMVTVDAEFDKMDQTGPDFKNGVLMEDSGRPPPPLPSDE